MILLSASYRIASVRTTMPSLQRRHHQAEGLGRGEHQRRDAKSAANAVTPETARAGLDRNPCFAAIGNGLPHGGACR